VNTVRDAEAQREVLRCRAVRPVADKHEARRNSLCNPAEDFNDIKDTLNRPEVREVNKQLFRGVSEVRPHGGVLGGNAHVDVAVHEVPDDLNLSLDAERLMRAVAQVRGDRGYAIGLLDAKLRDRQV